MGRRRALHAIALATALTSGSVSASELETGLPIDLGLYIENPGQALCYGPDSTLHVLGKRPGEMTDTAAVIYLRQDPAGAWSNERIPGPGGGWKSGVLVKAAAIDVDGAGDPVVAMSGKYCRKKGDKVKCTDRVWVAHRSRKGWSTRRVKVKRGRYGSVSILGEAGHGWTVAAKHTSHVKKNSKKTPWRGVVRLTGDGQTRWVKGRVDGFRLFRYKGAPALVYRNGKTGSVQHGRQNTRLTGALDGEVSAAPLPDGAMAFVGYEPGSDHAVGGRVEPGSVAVVTGIDTKESGWTNAMTATDNGVVAAWYYWRNNYNKGLKVGVFDGASWNSWVQLRDEERNLGWHPSIAVASDGRFAVLSMNKSSKRAVLRTYASIEAAEAAQIKSSGDWTERRRFIALFGYVGAWYHWTSIMTFPPNDEDYDYGEFEALTGEYALSPGLAQEAGFSGRIGPIDLAMQYLRRNDQNPAVKKIQQVQKFSGQLGIQSFPIPGSQTQLHFRVANVAGGYEAPNGDEESFSTEERMLEVRYVDKYAWHTGARYHAFRAPQDVYISQDFDLVDAFIADARFSGGALVFGYSLLDYLAKYEVRYFGPHFDSQIGIGLANVVLEPYDDGDTQTEVVLFGPAELNGGLTAYWRSRTILGAGAFGQVGARLGVLAAGIAEPSKKRDDDEDETYVNFMHLEARYGPYARLGVLF